MSIRLQNIMSWLSIVVIACALCMPAVLFAQGTPTSVTNPNSVSGNPNVILGSQHHTRSPNQSARCTGGFGAFSDITELIECNINGFVIPLIFSIALVGFFFGVTRFVVGNNAGNEKTTKQGRQFMIWGILAIFVMVSIWGILLTLINTVWL